MQRPDSRDSRAAACAGGPVLRTRRLGGTNAPAPDASWPHLARRCCQRPLWRARAVGMSPRCVRGRLGSLGAISARFLRTFPPGGTPEEEAWRKRVPARCCLRRYSEGPGLRGTARLLRRQRSATRLPNVQAARRAARVAQRWRARGAPARGVPVRFLQASSCAASGFLRGFLRRRPSWRKRSEEAARNRGRDRQSPPHSDEPVQHCPPWMASGTPG
jgi:hypothetical protein